MANPEIDSNYYASYKTFATTMRAWLVGLGIGAPVILLTNEKVYDAFKEDIPGAREIAYLYLVGCAIQIGVAFVYMLMMDYFYLNEDKINKLDKAEQAAEEKKHPQPPSGNFGLNPLLYRSLEWLSNSWKIEMSLHAVSIMLFAMAIYKSIDVLLPISAC